MRDMNHTRLLMGAAAFALMLAGPFRQNRCRITVGNKHAFIDEEGQTLVPPTFNRAGELAIPYRPGRRGNRDPEPAFRPASSASTLIATAHPADDNIVYYIH